MCNVKLHTCTIVCKMASTINGGKAPQNTWGFFYFLYVEQKIQSFRSYIYLFNVKIRFIDISLGEPSTSSQRKYHFLCHFYPAIFILYDFLGTVKAAPHECVIRTGQP